jgi:hypothetical protein
LVLCCFFNDGSFLHSEALGCIRCFSVVDFWLGGWYSIGGHELKMYQVGRVPCGGAYGAMPLRAGLSVPAPLAPHFYPSRGSQRFFTGASPKKPSEPCRELTERRSMAGNPDTENYGFEKNFLVFDSF